MSLREKEEYRGEESPNLININFFYRSARPAFPTIVECVSTRNSHLICKPSTAPELAHFIDKFATLFSPELPPLSDRHLIPHLTLRHAFLHAHGGQVHSLKPLVLHVSSSDCFFLYHQMKIPLRLLSVPSRQHTSFPLLHSRTRHHPLPIVSRHPYPPQHHRLSVDTGTSQIRV